MPAAFTVDGIGIIDDFHHGDMTGDEADALIAAAEGARARRGDRAVLAVCPADCSDKRAAFERAAYKVALMWSIRLV